MTLLEKKEILLKQLGSFDDPQDRLAFIVEKARRFPKLEESFKTDAFRLEGCLSNLWFVPEFRDDRCWFRIDSDSAIVRGIAGILADFYSGHTPAEILQLDPGFLADVGITQHLSMNRRNALARLWDAIRKFAARHEVIP